MVDSISSVKVKCDEEHRAGKKIVLATGFFDLLHEEHINFLKKAKSAGDILVAAVESDNRARRVKGEGRPVEAQSVRCEKVGKYADYVVALGDDFDNQEAYESLMAAVKPEIYAVSSHTSFQENKKQLSEKFGGKLVVVHAWNPEVSTSKILDSGKKRL